MAITYFGYCDSAGVGIGDEQGNCNDEFQLATAGYACPGSGAQNIDSIGAHCAGVGGNLLIGIYLASGIPEGDILVAEGNAEKLSLAAGQWLNWAAAELTWRNGYTQLTGGMTYRIVFTSDASTNLYCDTGRPAGTLSYGSGDYTAGMPDPLPACNAYTLEFNLRCGVEPAGGGGVDTAKKRMSATHLLVPSFPMAILPD
jgi:hypothetical protein